MACLTIRDIIYAHNASCLFPHLFLSFIRQACADLSFCLFTESKLICRRASIACLTFRDILDAHKARCLFSHPVLPFVRPHSVGLAGYDNSPGKRTIQSFYSKLRGVVRVEPVTEIGRLSRYFDELRDEDQRSPLHVSVSICGTSPGIQVTWC